MFALRQATADQEIPLGPFLDDTDGKTAETGLMIANTDIKLFKNGATADANKASGGATHRGGGRYYAVLDATDTDTIGSMEVDVHVAGALPVKTKCVVYHALVYDTLFGSAALSTLAPSDLVTASAIASAVLSEAALTPIHSDVRKVNNLVVGGTGVAGDPHIHP